MVKCELAIIVASARKLTLVVCRIDEMHAAGTFVYFEISCWQRIINLAASQQLMRIPHLRDLEEPYRSNALIAAVFFGINHLSRKKIVGGSRQFHFGTELVQFWDCDALQCQVIQAL
jgi:hypothetical protein